MRPEHVFHRQLTGRQPPASLLRHLRFRDALMIANAWVSRDMERHIAFLTPRKGCSIMFGDLSQMQVLDISKHHAEYCEIILHALKEPRCLNSSSHNIFPVATGCRNISPEDMTYLSPRADGTAVCTMHRVSDAFHLMTADIPEAFRALHMY